MSEKQSLAELAESYRENIKILDEQIARAKAERKNSKTEKEYYETYTKIKTLIDMRKECEQIANKLENYYDPEHKPYICHGKNKMYGGGRRARKFSTMD